MIVIHVSEWDGRRYRILTGAYNICLHVSFPVCYFVSHLHGMLVFLTSKVILISQLECLKKYIFMNAENKLHVQKLSRLSGSIVPLRHRSSLGQEHRHTASGKPSGDICLEERQITPERHRGKALSAHPVAFVRPVPTVALSLHNPGAPSVERLPLCLSPTGTTMELLDTVLKTDF